MDTIAATRTTPGISLLALLAEVFPDLGTATPVFDIRQMLPILALRVAHLLDS
jgi:hypothetical protein